MEMKAFNVLSSVQHLATSPVIAQQTAQSMQLQSVIQQAGASPSAIQQASHSAYQKRRRSEDYDSSYSSISPQSEPIPKMRVLDPKSTKK
eukprot:TRINITY_DN5039_c0_g1_i1.p1 TRINITY_DN5039_c0_g1~~TRINITY_DN5039_c0_g1_i1.p1  ORF type:complete len:101 (+),score=28.74 TRINITY_DN5039_c0_g1_i1:34-303(+)